jgi:hypothetical protein
MAATSHFIHLVELRFSPDLSIFVHVPVSASTPYALFVLQVTSCRLSYGTIIQYLAA